VAGRVELSRGILSVCCRKDWGQAASWQVLKLRYTSLTRSSCSQSRPPPAAPPSGPASKSASDCTGDTCGREKEHLNAA
jgi:hypothetical protein